MTEHILPPKSPLVLLCELNTKLFLNFQKKGKDHQSTLNLPQLGAYQRMNIFLIKRLELM